MNNVVTVFVAHPDDEVLGMGGTIAKHRKNRDLVHIVILAEGVTSRNNCNKSESEKKLIDLSIAAQKAHKILNSTSLELCSFPDNRMDSVDRLDVVKVVEKYLGQHNPNIVYTHHAGDLNIDHRRVHEAVVTACRPIPDNSIKRLLFFEVPSSTEYQTSLSTLYFMPNWFVNISKTFKTKMQALKEYESEMRSFPHARSYEVIESLAKWRGASVGEEVAEAFMLGRNLE
jgi:N-acetylglucosamine malate deacetylase 1